MRKRTQKGFTLVELVVVIVILGILAAVAIPRFIGLQGDARFSKLQAVEGALKSAAALTRAAAVVKAVTTAATGSTVSMDGTNVTLAYGYPTGDTAGIVVAANLAAIDGATAASVAGATTVTISGAGGDCKVVYTAPTVLDTPPTIVRTGTATTCT